MKIIFICKYNAFRSKIAESYFKKINKNPQIKVISRGFFMGDRADNVQRKMAKTLLDVKIQGDSVPVNINELVSANKIIVVANDIPKIMFNYSYEDLQKKLEIWRIKDEQKKNVKNIENIIKAIKKRVSSLVKELEKLK